MALAAPASAQVALPSREELDPARASPVPAAPRGELFDNIEKTPCSFAGSDLKLTLRNVEVRGAAAGALALTSEDLSPAYAREIGREIPIAAICDIRDRVSALYQRRGVLASVIIPEQRINDGRLVLDVIEARIASVTYHGDAGPAQKQVARYLDQLKGMAPFDLNLAQRYLLLASDIPGVRVQATLKPAPGGHGAVDLDIAVSRDAFDGSAQAQNYGSKTIGRELGLARIDFNSFTSLGERTSLIGYWTVGSDEQRVIQATESAKLGGSGLAVDLSGLPPAYIATAGFDPLRDEAEEYGHRLREAGVPVAVRRHAGLVHGFANGVGSTRFGRSAIREAIGALRLGLSAGAVRSRAL